MVDPKKIGNFAGAAKILPTATASASLQEQKESQELFENV